MLLMISCRKNHSQPEKTIVEGRVYDAITFEPLSEAQILLKKAEGSNNSGISNRTAYTDADGRYRFSDIPVGRYNIVYEKSGYHRMATSESSTPTQGLHADIVAIADSISIPMGGITGVVTDDRGRPVAGASIAIRSYDATITKGYFSSTHSDSHGRFSLGAIPLDATGVFKVRIAAKGFEAMTTSSVHILRNEMMVLHLELKEETADTWVFQEDFGHASDWEKTGLWHVHEGSGVYNQAYPEYVSLAPNDHSAGRIPEPFSGSRHAWYGSPETGNYMGKQSIYDLPHSGGTSQKPHHGLLTSPPISLQGLSQARLSFWSWFEIESENPGIFGYDLMEVYVADSHGHKVLLGRLNPNVYPFLEDRKKLPFTSGGFNMAPLWRYEEFDLNPFVGETIQLVFSFNTRDEKYNGFRGWLVDHIRIEEKSSPEHLAGQSPDLPLRQYR